jgi:ketosteroid isomerase-like protein
MLPAMVLLLATLLAATTPLAERDVRAVVDGWLAAQNAGDFAAYEKLYAARFTGIRRSGPRTVRFDRAGWMRDRGRMFKKPMTVGIGAVKIRAGGASALVTFTQTFAQGSYKDAGPKQIVVVRDEGALKIANEKMLRSRIDTPPVPADERFRFVVSGGILLSESPDEGWAAGATKYDGGDPAVGARRVDARKLPPELARWQGRRVRLSMADGSACDRKVKGFRLLSRSFPHFGTRQEWNEMKDAEVAEQVWSLGSKVLVADVDPPCEGAFWAQPAAQATPTTDAGVDADETLKARAVAELRKSAAWKEIQKSYLESPEAGARRWDGMKDADIAVRRFGARRGGKEIKLVSVTATVFAGCADFNADLWALYEERGGKLVPRNTPGQNAAHPIAAVDSDGDGDSELLFEPAPGNYGAEKGRLLLDGELWDTAEQTEIPFMDCPC